MRWTSWETFLEAQDFVVGVCVFLLSGTSLIVAIEIIVKNINLPI